jgi:hypothetical protein
MLSAQFNPYVSHSHDAALFLSGQCGGLAPSGFSPLIHYAQGCQLTWHVYNVIVLLISFCVGMAWQGTFRAVVL